MSDHPDEPKSRKAGYGNPPIKHQIKKGERRNPNGRRGKGRVTPKPQGRPNLADVVLEEMNRSVPQSDGTQIELHRRAVQAAALKAANGNLAAARLVLTELRHAEERRADEQNELLRSALDYRSRGLAIFEDHWRRELEPPDIVPHPAHIIIEDGEVRITGPVDHEGQLAWERLKRCVVVFTANLACAREQLREFPGAEWAEESLRSAERLRRKVMRMVPKGWDWRERVWNRPSVANDRARELLIRSMSKGGSEREPDQA